MPDLTESTSTAYQFDEEDVAYEEDIIRNPYSLKCWLRYIEHKRQAPGHRLNLLYERALKELPGSYKLWYSYLRLRRNQARLKCISDPIYEDVNNCFERALVFMHKMPRIWLDYCQWMMDQALVTRTRKVFDRVLRALPITQHHRIWPLYLTFVKSRDIPQTALRVYRRYLKLRPENAEEFIDFLVEVGSLNDAAVCLTKLVNDDKFCSKQGKTHHQLWADLCELISKNPREVTSLKVEPIIRQGLRRFTDQVGKLWCALADYYIRSGHFEKARDIYEEAAQTVMTVRDFSQVFDAYAQFEEKIIAARMEACKDEHALTADMTLELDLRLARFENLMQKRPLLLNSVLLRQNPHNVHEWHKRVELFDGQPQKIIDTYTEALQTVDPKLQTGKLFTLWVAFAKFYEGHKQTVDARAVFEKALTSKFAKVEELAALWCEFAEFELRNDQVEKAIELMKRATKPPVVKTSYFDEAESIQNRVHKSLKVWSMFADLEESFGTFDSTRKVYDGMINLKIATPQIIINYATFLEDNRYFEEAFKVYEKGVAMFRWPNVVDLWTTYLSKFIKRYGGERRLEGQKLERARDLFTQCLDGCPSELAKPFYLLWAKMEEDYGQPRRAMQIYDKATTKVTKEEMYDVYNVYVKKAAELFGVTQTRPIYETAIERLPEDNAREMCLRFAELETKLGEIDRARAVYSHCSQICDPRIHSTFWQLWKDFEIKHGNEDTLREMLRIKRSVQAVYNSQVNYMSAQMLGNMAPIGNGERINIKRSVQAVYNSQVNYMSAQMLGNMAPIGNGERINIKRSVQAVYNSQVNYMSAQMLGNMAPIGNGERINIKRSVQAVYNSQVNYMSAQMLGNMAPIGNGERINIKRSVQAVYNSQVNYMSAQMLGNMAPIGNGERINIKRSVQAVYNSQVNYMSAQMLGNMAPIGNGERINIKRSVQAVYNSQVNYMSAQMLGNMAPIGNGERINIKRSVQAVYNSQVNYMSAQMLGNMAPIGNGERINIKRSVQAVYNSQVNYMSAQMLVNMAPIGNEGDTARDSMALLEAKAQQLIASEEAAPAGGGSGISFVRAEAQEPAQNVIKNVNPDEIDVGDISDEDEEDGPEPQQSAVPSEVFGNLADEKE